MLDGSNKNYNHKIMEYFFCCCEFDGSISWIDKQGESNALHEDGSMLIKKDVWESDEYYCHTCEKPLKPIVFKNIKKKKRIEIYNMTEERRANWMKSLEIIDELEDEGEGTWVS